MLNVLQVQAVIVNHIRNVVDGQSDLEKERMHPDRRLALQLLALLQEAGLTKWELGALVTAQEWMNKSGQAELTVTYDG